MNQVGKSTVVRFPSRLALWKAAWIGKWLLGRLKSDELHKICAFSMFCILQLWLVITLTDSCCEILSHLWFSAISGQHTNITLWYVIQIVCYCVVCHTILEKLLPSSRRGHDNSTMFWGFFSLVYAVCYTPPLVKPPAAPSKELHNLHPGVTTCTVYWRRPDNPTSAPICHVSQPKMWASNKGVAEKTKLQNGKTGFQRFHFIKIALISKSWHDCRFGNLLLQMYLVGNSQVLVGDMEINTQRKYWHCLCLFHCLCHCCCH